MGAKYVQRGESIDYINKSGADIKAGDIIVLTDRCGVAAIDIKQNEIGSIAITGVFDMPKETAKAIEIGAGVYLNSSGAVTTDKSGNTPCGFAVSKAEAADTSVRVKIG